MLRLGLDDAGELLTLQWAAYVPEAIRYHDLAMPPLTQTLGELHSELADPDVIALGVRENGRLIGSVRMHRVGDAARLSRLIVAPDRQGEGLGSRLLLAAESVFPTTTAITLFTGEFSERTLELYHRHGYTETHRTPAHGYYLVHLSKHLVASQ